jgi:hypothetical protein
MLPHRKKNVTEEFYFEAKRHALGTAPTSPVHRVSAAGLPSPSAAPLNTHTHRALSEMDSATGDTPLRSKQAMMAAGMPPSKQMQSEESLPALDDEERKAVQSRLRAGGAYISPSARTTGRTPKGSSRMPGYMTPKSGSRSSRTPKSSRSAMLTNRTSSPTGRYHPDPERKLDIRKVRLWPNHKLNHNQLCPPSCPRHCSCPRPREPYQPALGPQHGCHERPLRHLA